MTNPTPYAALLPCPFCGGAAYTVSADDERVWFAGCRDCYCNVGESYDRSAMPEHMFSSEEEAIAAWNRRAGHSHDAGLLAALEELVAHCQEQERLVTEGLHHITYCGESLPLCNARAAIAAAKGAGK